MYLKQLKNNIFEQVFQTSFKERLYYSSRYIPYSAFFDVKDCDDNRQAFFLKDELESAFAEEIILVKCPLIKLVPIRISPDFKVGREINNVFYETLREPLASDTEQKFKLYFLWG